MVEIRALRDADDRSGFSSGDERLDHFFRHYAGQNQFRHHIGVTYVAVENGHILAFATVSPASLDVDELPDGRRMPPYPLPILRLARLAVGTSAQGRDLGRAMLRFVFDLAARMRDELGCVGVVVDAKPAARGFYARFGFVELEPVAGASTVIPRPIPMFLPLGSVPGTRG
jgi:GNAT superfamily N-acetyltransferase